MKKLFTALCPVLALILLIGVFSGCNGTEKIDSELFDYFTAMYDAFNGKDYAKFLSYYNYSDEEKAERAAYYESMSDSYHSEYTVEKVESSKRDDGAYAVTVTTIILSNNLVDSTVSTLRSTVYYLMEKTNGVWSISDFYTGEVIDLLPDQTGAVDYVTHDNHSRDETDSPDEATETD